LRLSQPRPRRKFGLSQRVILQVFVYKSAMHISSYKTILVHPNPVEREALGAWFQRQLPFQFLAKMKDLNHANQRSDLAEIDMAIIFDYGKSTLSAQITNLRRANKNLKLLVFAANHSISEIQDVICAGVHAYIDLCCETDEWDLAIKAVLAGHVYYCQTVMLKLAGAYGTTRDAPQPPKTEQILSPRELEILNLVAKEYSTPQIANNLFISTKTVETHRRNLFKKLGVRNAVGLTKVALRMGLF
jgi:DNA-binding NarL/FixJ family response regulator